MGWWQNLLGKVGVKALTEPATPKPMPTGKTKYKDIYFHGSTFPDDPYRIVPIKLNSTIRNEYSPAMHKALPNAPLGLQCLLIAMTHQEGFSKGTRAYRTRNPGNIGNTDSGANNTFPSLEAGIIAQSHHLQAVATGGKKNYPLGKFIDIKPFYSKEIENNPSYGLPPYLPGYKFTYTGQLDQFIKLYSTGARVTNSYLNVIISYFKQNGLEITPESKLQDIINL